MDPKEQHLLATWNIRRGLIVRELELKNMLEEEKIDVIFITETDTRDLENENSYQVEGYKTFLPKRNMPNSKIRIISLVKIKLLPRIKLRSDKCQVTSHPYALS